MKTYCQPVFVAPFGHVTSIYVVGFHVDFTFAHIPPSHIFVTFRGDAARFRKSFFKYSKNVTIFLELGTNVTILSHRHVIFLGSAWHTTQFQNLARSLVLGSIRLERPSMITHELCSLRVSISPPSQWASQARIFLNWSSCH